MTKLINARRKVLAAAGSAGLLSIVPSVIHAQSNWPNRPVTVVCPWGAGGGTDATARIIASLLEKDLG